MPYRVLSILALAVALLVGGCRAQLWDTGSPSGADRRPATGAEVTRVPAFRETRQVPNHGDAADDPAIWIDPDDPRRSIIIGTDKRGGLGVYDLQGTEIQYLAGGRPNNVDLRRGFRLAGRRVTIVAAEERDRDQILLFRLDPRTRRLRPVAAGRIPAGMEVYGSCMYRSPVSGRFYVFVSSKSGRIRQFRLLRVGTRVRAQHVRTFDVGDQTEACVADDRTGDLYVSEENRGIWRYRAEPGAGGGRTLVDAAGGDGHLTPDVEGLTLADGYLIASNQGRNSYTVYRRGPVDRYVTTFRIVAGHVDGVHNTDGIDATSLPLGRDFPTGVLVAQDGDNRGGNQNFKLVRWDLAAIVRAAGVP
jgi:3-phytase